MSLRAAAVVPARDEAGRVGPTVRALRGLPQLDEVVVVDDGSRDATAAEAEAAGARVVRTYGRGKGAALTAGAAQTDAPVLLFCDADLAETAAATSVLVDAVLGGAADLAIAAPPRGEGPSGFGIVERLAREGIRRLTGVTLVRPLSGQRAMRREVLEAAGSLAPRFGIEVGLTIDALRAGFRVVELPCDIAHRRTGRDLRGFVHRARQGRDVTAALATRARRR